MVGLVDPTVERLDAHTFAFTTDRPSHFYIRVNAPWAKERNNKAAELAVFANAYDQKPDPGDPRVVNAGRYPSAQAALDAAASGQIVYFPAGSYEGFSIPRDDLTVYLDAGAVISGGKNTIAIDGRKKVRITGRGCVRTSAHFIPNRADGLVLEGILWITRYNGKGFMISVCNTDGVLFSNFKFFMSGSGGGIQNNNTVNCTMREVFSFSTDDPVAIKALQHPLYGNSDPIRVHGWKIQDTIIRGGPFKIGSEVTEGVENCTWDNVVSVNYGLRFADKNDNPFLRNLVFNRVRVVNPEVIFFDVGYHRYIHREKVIGQVPSHSRQVEIVVRDMTVDRIYPNEVNAPGFIVEGEAGHDVRITFHNLKVAGKYIKRFQDLVDLGLSHAFVRHATCEFLVTAERK